MFAASTCRLLRWGTNTAAELAAADDANAKAQLGAMDIDSSSSADAVSELGTGRPAAKRAARYTA